MKTYSDLSNTQRRAVNADSKVIEALNAYHDAYYAYRQCDAFFAVESDNLFNSAKRAASAYEKIHEETVERMFG